MTTITLHMATGLHTLTVERASVIVLAVRAEIWAEAAGGQQSLSSLGGHHTAHASFSFTTAS